MTSGESVCECADSWTIPIPITAPSNSTQKPGLWDYFRNSTFCTDMVNATEKAGYIGGGIFVIGTGLDATGVAIPAGVALQTYGAEVMAVSTSLGCERHALRRR